MPSGGHNRKNADLKLLQGTDRPDREDNSPKPEPIAGKCPSWVPNMGKRFWKEYAPKLERNGLLTELDRHSFALLCYTYATWRKAESELYCSDLEVEGYRKKTVKRNPVATIAHQARNDFMEMCKLFGMYPVSRNKISMPEKKSEDEFEDFLNKGKK